jgi:hypothetical protein
MDSTISDAPDLLMLQFLAWVSSRHRTYADAMNAWQSTCPRHTIWEDAIIDGLIELNRSEIAQEPQVTLTARGKAYLKGTT